MQLPRFSDIYSISQHINYINKLTFFAKIVQDVINIVISDQHITAYFV